MAMWTNLYICNDVQAQAYEGGAANGTFNDDDGEFASGDYTNISVDDSNYVEDTTTTDGQYQYHRFVFTTPDNLGKISRIDINYKGWGQRTGTSILGTELWVKENGSWVEKDSHTEGSSTLMALTIEKNFPKWIASSTIEVAAQCALAATDIGGISSELSSYYVEVIVYGPLGILFRGTGKLGIVGKDSKGISIIHRS